MDSTVFPLIIILDENLENLALLQRTLEKCRPDVRVSSFQSGESMLGYLNREMRHGRKDSMHSLILINDSQSPEKDLELIGTIKSDTELKRIPLIIFIGPQKDTYIHKLYERGVNTVITRPQLPAEFEELIERICDYWFGPPRM